MTNIDQAARRAAEELYTDGLLCDPSPKWEGDHNAKPEHLAEATKIIAAELAPLQERLVEAERLLGRARKPVADWSSLPEERNPTLADIDKFLAAKENGNG